MTDTKLKVYENKYVEFIYKKGPTGTYKQKQFHSFCEIFLFLNGNAEFISTQIRQKLEPNQMLIIPPGEYHHFNIADDAPDYERIILSIKSGFLPDEIFKNAISGKNILNLNPTDRLVKNLHYLHQCYDNMSREDFDVVLNAVATDVVYLIKYKKPSETGLIRTDTFLDSLVKYIDENYKTDLTVLELSNKFNYSVSHISHTFKEYFGISIKSYIIQKRLNSIQAKMMNGGKAYALSQEYGFSNYSTFYKLYKKNFGVSPLEYKKNQNK